MVSSTSSQLLDLGFIFYPPKKADSPGHPQLDIILREKPTGRHIDPEQILVSTISKFTGIETIKISHPWTGEKQQNICAGRIIVFDFNGKQIEAFTFGGTLSIDSSTDITLCKITSPAPILDIKTETSVGAILAYEVQIVLAEKQATLSDNPGQFEQWLIATDPVTLYNWVVRTLQEKFKERPTLESSTPPNFLTFINTIVDNGLIQGANHDRS